MGTAADRYKVISFLKFVILLSLFLFSGCVGSSAEANVPDWISLDPPAEDDFYLFSLSTPVVGSKPLSAYRKLTTSLVSELMALSGYSYRSYDEALAAGYLFDRISVALNRKLSGVDSRAAFEIRDVFYQKRRSRLKKIYMLAAVEKSEWDQVLNLLKPLPGGRGLTGWNGPWSRVLLNWDLAIEAAEQDVPDNRRFVVDYLDRCRFALDDIHLTPLSFPDQLFLRETPKDSFRLQAVDGEGEVLSGLPVVALWRSESDSGALQWQSRLLSSDDAGVVEFLPPPVMIPESGRIGFELQRSRLKIASGVDNPEYIDLFNEVRELAASRSVGAEPEVLSRARDFHTGVLIVQLDSAGNVTAENTASEVLASGMNERGFHFSALHIDNFDFLAVGDSVEDSVHLTAQLVEFLPAGMDRLVLGFVGLSSFGEEDALYQATVEGEVFLLSGAGKKLYSHQTSASSRGNHAPTVLGLSWRSFGKSLLQDFEKNLP